MKIESEKIDKQNSNTTCACWAQRRKLSWVTQSQLVQSLGSCFGASEWELRRGDSWLSVSDKDFLRRLCHFCQFQWNKKKLNWKMKTISSCRKTAVFLAIGLRLRTVWTPWGRNNGNHSIVWTLDQLFENKVILLFFLNYNYYFLFFLL